MSLKEYKEVPRNEYNKVKIYIAGPMRGYENLNHEAFDLAERSLSKSVIFDPVNPAKMDRAFGLDSSVDMTKEELKDALKRDVDVIFESDAMYMLRGWERSEGAKMEHSLAVALGMSIHYE
tara:strand:+ start:99 stop:461 length:363 start_codon:yes stop_codon:yes gene_type:complete